MKWLFQEPRRDPELGDSLRKLERVSGQDDADLRQRILAAATPQLNAMRSPSRHWWEWVTRWMPVAISRRLAGRRLDSAGGRGGLTPYRLHHRNPGGQHAPHCGLLGGVGRGSADGPP